MRRLGIIFSVRSSRKHKDDGTVIDGKPNTNVPADPSPMPILPPFQPRAMMVSVSGAWCNAEDGRNFRLTNANKYDKVIKNEKYTVAFRMKANVFTQHTSGIFINSGSTDPNENWLSALFGPMTGGETVENTVDENIETYLGVNYWDTPFNGLIDDLYIYNGTTFTDEQAAELFEGTAVQ